jgi:hypothetical protein
LKAIPSNNNSIIAIYILKASCLTLQIKKPTTTNPSTKLVCPKPRPIPHYYTAEFDTAPHKFKYRLETGN